MWLGRNRGLSHIHFILNFKNAIGLCLMCRGQWIRHRLGYCSSIFDLCMIRYNCQFLPYVITVLFADFCHYFTTFSVLLEMVCILFTFDDIWSKIELHFSTGNILGCLGCSGWHERIQFYLIWVLWWDVFFHLIWHIEADTWASSCPSASIR